MGRLAKTAVVFTGVLFILSGTAGCALFEKPAGEELIVEQEEEIDSLKEENENLEDKIENLENKIDEQKEQLAEKDKKIEQTDSNDEKISSLEEEVEKLEKEKKRLEDLQEENIRLEESLADIKEAQTHREGENVVVTLDAEILFNLGEHSLREQSKKTLDELADVISQYSDRPIVVEGHTDTVPVLEGSQFPTNWHLSAARAVSVVQYLVTKKELPAEQFFAGGYGEQHPVKPNNSEANRAENRRVEIKFLPSEMSEEIVEPEE